MQTLHSVLFNFTQQVTSGYSMSLIRDPARGTSQFYIRVAWTSACKQFFPKSLLLAVRTSTVADRRLRAVSRLLVKVFEQRSRASCEGGSCEDANTSALATRATSLLNYSRLQIFEQSSLTRPRFCPLRNHVT